MDLKKCNAGHFYDGDKFDTCPHCENSTNSNKSDETNHTKAMFVNTEVIKPKEEVKSKKMKLFSKVKNSEKELDDVTSKLEAIEASKKISNSLSGKKEDEASKEKISFASEIKEEVAEPVSLSTAVNIAKAIDEDNNKTIGFFSTTSGDEPVVGWLVCTKGQSAGDAYKLVTGKNAIGRSSAMDVVILGDSKISRERHAVVLYEPAARKFFLPPGDCNGMVYINGEILLEVKELAIYNRILIGDTELMFVPLCSKDFSWENENS